MTRRRIPGFSKYTDLSISWKLFLVPTNCGRNIKKLVIGTCIVLLLLVAGAGIFYFHAATKDFYFKEISALVSDKAGYALAKSEPLEFSLFPRPTLTATRLKITNPSVDDNNLIADVDKVSVILHWLPLLRLDLVLDARLAAPRLTLTVNTQGTENWMTAELESISGGLPFDLAKIDTSETEFLFKNQQKNEILGLDLQQFDIDLKEGGGMARIETAGRLGGSRLFVIGDINLDTAGNRLTVNVDFGAGKARGTRVDAISAPSVSWWIRQNAILFPLQGSVEGEIKFQPQVVTGELDFEFATASLDEFLHFIDDIVEVRPGIGPIRASGSLVLTGSDLDIHGLNAHIARDEIEIGVRGSVSNLLSEIETALEFNARVDDGNTIVEVAAATSGLGIALTGYPLPVQVNAVIKAKEDVVSVENLDGTLHLANLSSRITGRMSLIGEDLDFDTRIAVEAPDSTDLARILGIEAPDSTIPGPLSITADVSGTNKRFKISDARAEFDGGQYQSTLEGTVDLAGRVPELDLKAHISIEDAIGIRKYLRQLPDPVLDKLSVSLDTDAKGPIDDLALRDLKMKLVRVDREWEVAGDLSGLPHDPHADINFHFSMQEPIDLDRYFPNLGPLQLIGPLDLAGEVSYSDQTLYVRHLALQAEQTDVAGVMKFDFSVEPPQIFIVLDSRQLFTKLIVPDAEPEQPAPIADESASKATTDSVPQQEESQKQDQDPGDLFMAYTNGVGINTDWVRDLNLYARFIADRANFGDYNFEDFYLTIDAREGIFTLAEYEVTLEGRPMSISGSIDTNTDPPTFRFSGQMEGETVETLLNLEDDVFVGGELGGEFNLHSQGDTLGSVIQHLNGQALLTMGPLTIKSNALNIVSSDILHSMLGGITKSKEEKKSTRYQCGVLGVDVKKGIARINKSFTLQAKDYNLAGKGKIDLNTGYVDLAAQPRAKKGLGLSLSTLVGGFKIQGHIAAPKFGLGGGGLVTAAIAGYALSPTLAAATATNPVTATIVATGFVAKGLFDRLTASRYSCKNTLKRIDRDRTKAVVTKKPHSGKMSF